MLQSSIHPLFFPQTMQKAEHKMLGAIRCFLLNPKLTGNFAMPACNV